MSSRVKIGRRDCKTVYGVCIATRSKIGTQRNIAVTDLLEGEDVYHGLGSTKVEVSFFDTNGRNIKEIDFEPISDNEIRVYGPIIEGVTWSFTGDIFVKRRN